MSTNGRRFGQLEYPTARLARDGARVLRTDLDGDLAVVLSDEGVGVVVRGRVRP